MPVVRVGSTNFHGGEISPYLVGRTDDPRYKNSLHRLDDMIVMSEGGIVRRPGTKYEFALPDETATARLVPFETGDGKFLLVFQAGATHFYKESGGSFTRIVDTGYTPGYQDDTGAIYRYTSHNQFFLHRNKRAVALTHGMGPVRVSSTGTLDTGLSASIDYWVYARSHFSGAATMPPATGANDPDMVVHAKADFEGQDTQAIAFATSAANLDTQTFVNLNGDGTGPITIKLNTTSNYYQLPNPYSLAELADIQFSARDNVLIVTHLSHAPMYIYKLVTSGSISEIGDDKWRMEQAPLAAGPIEESETDGDSSNGVEVYSLTTLPPVTFGLIRLTHVGGYLGQVLQPLTHVVAGDVLLGKTIAGTGADPWYAVVIDKQYVTGSSGHRGYMMRIPSAGPPVVTEYPDVYWAVNAYGKVRGWPASAAHFGGRTWMCGGGVHPWKIHGSSLSRDNYFAPWEDDMTVTANTAISLDPFKGSNSSIVTAGAIDELIIGSDDAVWAFGQMDYSQAVSATNAVAVKISDIGAYGTNMAALRDQLAYISADGRRIIMLSSLAKTGVRGYDYKKVDLTGRASHLFAENKATRIAAQSSPDTIYWVINDNNKLFSCTVDIENGVAAWSKHPSSYTNTAAYEDMCVMTRDDADAQVLYTLVKRTINSATHRYIESVTYTKRPDRPSEDETPADSHIVYSGASTTTITGLSHLEGEQVIAWDGLVEQSATVTGGQIVLGTAVTKVCVGLAYLPAFEPVLPEIEMADGPTDGTLRYISQADMLLHKSFGGLTWYHSPVYIDALDYPEGTSGAYTGRLEVNMERSFEYNTPPLWSASTGSPMTVLAMTFYADFKSRMGQR